MNKLASFLLLLLLENGTLSRVSLSFVSYHNFV